jgi:hypothetical protein
MLADRLPAHVEAAAELAQRLAALRPQAIEQFAPALIGQRLEHRIQVIRHAYNMQPFGCLSSGTLPGWPGFPASIFPAIHLSNGEKKFEALWRA